MSARLQELLRQKALLEEQAAWLAREIATEQARAGVGPAPTGAPTATAPAPSPGPAAPSPAAMDAEADAIIDQYRDSAKTDPQQVKRGCILYFVGALALIALGLLAIHFMAHRR